MKVPDTIIQKVNNSLGVSGSPHFAQIPHEHLATDCVSWKVSSDDIDEKLTMVRNILVTEKAIAYKSIDWWWGVFKTISERIVVCPSTDQFDILRFEQGAAPMSDSEYFIKELKKYDTEYGIDITGAGYATLEFILLRIPEGEKALELSNRIKKFAPDIVYGTGEELEYIDFKSSNGRVALWWD